jgi:RNA polymerase sigma factor (sigma-70 family)
MVRLADGDRDAFDPLYDVLWPVFLRFARRALAGSPDAEDAAQGALMKVFSRACELDPDRDALSWALGIVAYECRTLRKKAHRRREDMADPETWASRPATGLTAEDALIARDLEDAAEQILGTLRPEDAETLRLVAGGERPEGVAAPTFRKRVERALSRLRTAWSTKHGTETL